MNLNYGCYPRLEHATMRERDHFEVHADGRMLHWPDIDEDIEVQHIIQGRMPVKKGQEFLAVADGHATYGKGIVHERGKSNGYKL